MGTVTKIISTNTIKATVTQANDSTSGQQIVPTAHNPTDKTYNSTSTPPGTEYATDTVTLTGSGAGTHTIDLTDLLDNERIAVTGEGLKVQEIRVQASANNSAAITIAAAASDGYELFGTGNEADVQIGALKFERFNDKLEDIGTVSAVTQTDITFSGTGGDEFSYELVMG